MFVECARALARKALEEGGKTDQERITYAFRRTLARPPIAQENDRNCTLLEKKENAAGLLTGWLILTTHHRQPQPPADLPPASPHQLGKPYTVVSRVLLNLDETNHETNDAL